MPRFERLTPAGVERIRMEQLRREVFTRYFRLVEETAAQTGKRILEIIETDLVKEMEGDRKVPIPQLFRALRKPADENTQKPGPEADTVIYTFPTAYGNLIYYPEWCQVISPLLPNGTSVHLSRAEGFLLEALISNPQAQHTYNELHSLLERKFNETPGPITSNRINSIMRRLRRKLGDHNTMSRGSGPKFRLIHGRRHFSCYSLSSSPVFGEPGRI